MFSPSGVKISAPMGSVDFLDDYQSILKRKFTPRTVNDCLNPTGMTELCRVLFTVL